MSHTPGESGQSQHTGTLSQVHTHIDTQIHADSNTETPHTHATDVACTWGPEHAHTPDSHTDPPCKPAPHTAVTWHHVLAW